MIESGIMESRISRFATPFASGQGMPWYILDMAGKAVTLSGAKGLAVGTSLFAQSVGRGAPGYIW